MFLLAQTISHTKIIFSKFAYYKASLIIMTVSLRKFPEMFHVNMPCIRSKAPDVSRINSCSLLEISQHILLFVFYENFQDVISVPDTCVNILTGFDVKMIKYIHHEFTHCACHSSSLIIKGSDSGYYHFNKVLLS